MSDQSLDWIDNFLSETANIPSPKPFRLWTAISTVSGVLERRVWTVGSGGRLYPNVFALLIGNPGSGKSQAISRARDIWSRIKDIYISPDNMTKASFIETLMKCSRAVQAPDSPILLIYNALNIAAGEFGVFFPNHDLEFISVMNLLYDSPDSYKEDRIVAGERKVEKPHLVILAGTQPDFLSTFLPDKAWGMGFCSRLIMVYGVKSDVKKRSMLADSGDDYDTVNVTVRLAQKLQQAMTLVGQFTWSPDAKELLDQICDNDIAPIPNHPKLEHYISRRPINLVKLSMISAVSSKFSLTVNSSDVKRAYLWLTDAERAMPEIFNSMSLKSDEGLLEDLVNFIGKNWLERKKATTKAQIYFFLKSKLPVERIPRILEIAKEANMIEDGFYPDEWKPRNAGK